MAEPRLLGLAHLGDDDQDGVDDRLLVLEPPLLPQHVRQEGHQHAMLLRELEAHRTDRVDDDNLELVGDLACQRPSQRAGVRMDAKGGGAAVISAVGNPDSAGRGAVSVNSGQRRAWPGRECEPGAAQGVARP